MLIAFLLALVLYATGFWFIESRRVAESPWVIGFQVTSDSQVVLDIHQESLRLGPVQVRIDTPDAGVVFARQEVVFGIPKPVPFAVPGGRCVFEDATFLPGTVVLEISGVTLQVLPRTLTIGTNEFSWTSNQLILVTKDGLPRVVR